MNKFDPYRSKLLAAEKNGLKFNFKKNDVVLYLGASHGYTVSYLAEKVGFIFAVEFSPYVIVDLIKIAKKLKNVAPILADANKPLNYFKRMSGVDIIFQDISQRNQVEIFLKNVELFLKDKGSGFLSIKCRCIDVTAEPEKVLGGLLKELEKHLKIVDYKLLEPYEKDHYLVMVKKC